MLTDDQRAQAVETMSVAIDGAHNWKHMREEDRADTRTDVGNALTALLDAGFIVLHPDARHHRSAPTVGRLA